MVIQNCYSPDNYCFECPNRDQCYNEGRSKTSKRAEVKLSTFIISLIVCSLVIVYFMTFIAGASAKYGVSFNNATMTKLNKLDSLINTTQDIRDRATSIKQQTNVLDVIGGYFNDAYATLRVSSVSLSLFDEMNNDAIQELPLGNLGDYTRKAISTIVILLIVIGVLISAIVQRANL